MSADALARRETRASTARPRRNRRWHRPISPRQLPVLGSVADEKRRLPSSLVMPRSLGPVELLSVPRVARKLAALGSFGAVREQRDAPHHGAPPFFYFLSKTCVSAG